MSPEEFARVYDSEEFVRFTQQSRSVVSGEGPCVCAHITPNDDPPSGLGRKADAKWITPLTYAEHLLLHSRGKESCQLLWGTDLVEAAKRHWARWQREKMYFDGDLAA